MNVNEAEEIKNNVLTFMRKVKNSKIDMVRLKKIQGHYALTKELTDEELSFIYEMAEKTRDEHNCGDFYLELEMTVGKILMSRNIRQDFAKIFKCEESQISLSTKDALMGNTVRLCHLGDLNIHAEESLDDQVLPRIVTGSLRICPADKMAIHAKNLVLPEIIGEDLLLCKFIETEGVVLPDSVGGYISGGYIYCTNDQNPSFDTLDKFIDYFNNGGLLFAPDRNRTDKKGIVGKL